MDTTFDNSFAVAGASVESKAKARFPKQIKYIVGNEAAERFSFYGMRSILVIFMVQHLLMQQHDAKGIFHTFVMACYFFPLIGAYISDRYWGKYKTIMYLSLVYCLGHLVLAINESQNGLYLGLLLIAIGAGGIKPCVSAHVGDQFDKTNESLLPKIFEIFYFSVNFGSTFSTLLIPWVLPRYGAGWAFGIPGILMAIATYVFWLGRKHFVTVPPTGKENSMQFLSVVLHGLKNLGAKVKGSSWLDSAVSKFGANKVEGAKSALAVFAMFAPVIGFWALFDQHSSSWILQAQMMNRVVGPYTLESSQIAALNPIMVMGLIPLFSLVLYPAVERMGIRVTALRKMGVGMLLAGLSFVWVGVLQSLLESGVQLSILWQVPAFLILTASEVMVSIPGLEFAYTQAPREMKSTIMSFWMITISLGNFLTAAISFINPFSGGASEFYFYSVLMIAVAVIFVWMSRLYKERNFIEHGMPVGH